MMAATRWPLIVSIISSTVSMPITIMVNTNSIMTAPV